MRWLFLLAAVLLVMLKVWPKGIKYVLLLAGLLTALVLYLEHEEAQRLALVHIEVAYAPTLCPEKKPLRVVFTNTANAELEKLLFTIHARIPGYSSIVTPYTYKQYTSEKILAPQGVFSACHEVPLLSRTPAADYSLDQLEWFALPDKAWFQ